MEILNDLIYNPEDNDSIETAGLGGDDDQMDNICITSFCFDSVYSSCNCGEPVMGTLAYLPIGNG